MSKRTFAYLALLLGCLVVCNGCGGGGSPGGAIADATRGSVEFTIIWPPAGRLIPVATQSLAIRVTSGSQAVTSKLIPRPPAGTNTTSVRFDALGPGIVTVSVDAFPNADGTGVIQATGSITVAIISGQTTQAVIDPASTVDHLDVTPSPVFTIKQRTVPLSVSPRNAANALVLVAPASITFTSADPTIASVDSGGAVTGVALGSTTVRVVEIESGHTAQVDVNVVRPIVVNPPQATITIGDSVQFTAVVTQLSSQNVTWSVAEQGNIGSVDNTGKFTASQQPGTFHVVATSVSDPTQSAQATVIVQSGSGTINIQ